MNKKTILGLILAIIILAIFIIHPVIERYRVRYACAKDVVNAEPKDYWVDKEYCVDCIDNPFAFKKNLWCRLQNREYIYWCMRGNSRMGFVGSDFKWRHNSPCYFGEPFN